MSGGPTVPRGALAWLVVIGSLAAAAREVAVMADDEPDPYVWLEDVAGERALEWVRERNARCREALVDDTSFRALESRLLSILDSAARIPYVSRIGDRLYNFWRDAGHPKGLWRRTTLASYRTPEPVWETVLDLDALAAAEGENWVWHGATVLEPEDRLCLVSLSRGGADAEVVREFNLETGAFVAGGFELPEAKSRVAWRGHDSLFIATDFGPGSLTASGYPRTVREWTRGAAVTEAPIVFEGRPDDMSVAAFRDLTPGFERDFVTRQITFWTNEFFLWRDGKLFRIDKPLDANATVHREWLLLELRSPWTAGGTVHPAGSLIATDLEDFLAGGRRLTALFTPTPRTSLVGCAGTRGHLLLTTLDNVRSRADILTFREGDWHRVPLPGVPAIGTASVAPVDAATSDDFFLITSSPVAPPTLALGSADDGHREPEVLKRSPAFFDATGIEVRQGEAVSRDGTRVPFFHVGRPNPPGTPAPTLLYGYGGFEIPLVPAYDPITGAAWLEHGGQFVIANIRGGGEFGPAWHQAALKANRPRAYEDFIAVAEEIIHAGLTTPALMGIKGGSNGGLLVGNIYCLRPDLCGAVVCQVPLLDMRRFHTLLAGASWMGEYGNPDEPEAWAFIRGFSPYHMVRRDRNYPPLLITTSTRDDRVHPAHARKFAARLLEFGKQVLSYENIEGGHGGAADNRQKAFLETLSWRFLQSRLGSATAEPGGRSPAPGR